MKNLFVILFVICFTFHPSSAHAGAAGGGATEITQVLNNLQLIPININDLVTSVSTEGSFFKTVILDPIANQLINQAIQGSANSILSWVNGGFQGQPLVVSNPEKFLQATELTAAAKNLKAIPEDSLFGNSIFSSLSKGYSFDALSVADKVKTLSKTEGPSILQNSMCDDDTLTSLATEDVASQGEVTNAAIVARKNELYAYACSGDPEDPATAKKLDSLVQQRPEIGGWDYLLCVSGGTCNESAKKAKIAQVISDDADNKARLKERDLYDGLNTLSATECTDEGSAGAQNEDGSPAAEGTASCDNEVVTTPSDSVQALSNLAQGAGLQRMFNLTTDGSFSGMLSGFVTTMITSGLNNAFKGSSSRSTNYSSVTYSNSGQSADLTSTSTKADFVGPMKNQITVYAGRLQDLQGIDQNYKSDMIAYETRIQEGARCYQGLVDDGLISSGDSRIAFYQSRQERIDQVRNKITPELSKIAEALAYISETLGKIQASSSSQEITNIFNAYTTKVQTSGYPSTNAPTERRVEYETDKSNISRDTNVSAYLDQCHQIRAQANNSNGY